MGNELNETAQVYERLWTGAVSAFAQNEFGLDPHLPEKSRDDWRGVTLVFRPPHSLQNSIAPFLKELQAVVPAQYFYRPEEFHVTVLAILPGSELWREKTRQLDAFKTIIADVLSRHRKFSISFRGITASPDAVMIQGFPDNDTLSQIRTDLRKALRQNQLGDGLDVRYKIQTAHITVMRFCHAQIDARRLLALLQANRTTHFGEASVENLELIFGDWYASAKATRTLQEYPLKA